MRGIWRKGEAKWGGEHDNQPQGTIAGDEMASGEMCTVHGLEPASRRISTAHEDIKDPEHRHDGGIAP